MPKIFPVAALYFAVLLSSASCRTQQNINNEYAFYEFPTQFICSEPTGEITIKCWGNGNSTNAAVKNALKNGVETILFKGITTNGNPIPPLVTSVNNDGIRMYFDKFFQNGKYLNYIKENKGTDRVQAKSSNFRQIGIVANVDAESLKQLLIKDKIIPT